MGWKDLPYVVRGDLYLWKKDSVFEARVAAATATNGFFVGPDGVTRIWAYIYYTSITKGAETDIRPGMTLCIGTAAGKDDLGRTRIRTVDTYNDAINVWSSHGVSDSELTPDTGAYITVLNEHRVWNKKQYFYQSSTAIMNLIDGVGAFNNVPTIPKANAGGPYFKVVDWPDNTVLVDWDSTPSFATAPGASISARAWTLPGCTPSSSSNATLTDVVTPTGQRIVSLEVTDSNAKKHTQNVHVAVVPRRRAIDTSGATFTASKEHVLHPVADAFDGNLSTYWAALLASAEEWIKAAFSTGQRAVAYRLQRGSVLDSYMPPDWIVQGSRDDTHWTDLDSQTGVNWLSITESRHVIHDPQFYTSYRLLMTKPVGYSETSYTGATFTAHSYQTGFPPSQAFDGSLSTRWVSLGAYDTSWIKCQYPAAKTVTRYGIIVGLAYTSGGPKEFYLQGSHDNANWDMLDYRDDVTYGSSTDEQVFDVTSPGSYLYYRLFVMDTVSGTNYVEITELNLYESSYPNYGLAELVLYEDNPDLIQGAEVVRWHVGRDGQEVSFLVHDNIPLDTYPRGSMVMFAEDERYGGVAGNLYGPADRLWIHFTGWIHKEPTVIRGTPTGRQTQVILECHDIAARLKTIGVIPTVMHRESSPGGIFWNQMAGLNPDRLIWFVLQWFTSALDITPFVWSGQLDGYAIPHLATTGDDPWTQCANLAQTMRHALTCDEWGWLRVLPDPMLQPLGSRTGTVQQTLTPDDYTDLEYTDERPPRVGWLWSEAVERNTANASSSPTYQVWFAVEPGEAPGLGPQVQQAGQQIVQNQAELLAAEGFRYAVYANPTETFFRLILPYGGFGGIRPALMTWVQVQITEAVAAQRGWTVNERFLPVAVEFDIFHFAKTRTLQLAVEREHPEADPADPYTPD